MTLKEMDQNYVLQTYARNYVNFVKGENSILYDEDGKDYVDFGSGIAVCSVGHGNPRLAKAICDQVSNITHISNLYLIEPQARLAKRLAELSGIDAVTFFANSGAEANEGAIKMARKYGEVEGEVKRYKIITLEHSFHGRTITALKATGQESMHNYFGPFPDGFVYAKNIADIYNHIDDHTVAVMIELVQGEGGVQPMQKQEVQALASELKKRDILLIVDEVQTGIYRTSELLASNLYEITPDIITLAKGLGGGVPIGAIMTTHKEILKTGEHGSTFGGNYLSTRAALEVLSILEEHKNSGDLDHIMIMFEERLKEIADKYSNLFEKEVGVGFMRGLRVKEGRDAGEIIKAAFKNRVIVLKAGRNTVRFLPVLTMTKEEMLLGFERFESALSSL
ncbi:aspartate aminotransferase family protein [Hydrogenimonas thermophila]|uniref:aspartate aminotransferase family protein n=1 Tax=Hydrogenimonas thermophila TaxID=223786 RepID=UPI0029371F3E|nr:aspartate aminotransferase family protein [Hydrogenimonas thermophila]WOE68864.1 aspartate aminotransferase family protein [Hydrogenimonas thermophila]WOE71372.1 aspartate aminotransferase family protein [Hydrogenimonas thermophila]